MSQNYDKIRLLGEGAFGKAFLAKCKTSKNYIVLKEINLSKMSPKDKQEARREVMVLSRLEHCCIVKYLNSYETTTFLVIVMEFCDNGDLQHQLKSRITFVPENQVLNWFVQICLALKHLHDRKILHRDIKSQNVFLTKSGLVKLGDFGIAKMLNNTSELALTQAGTPYYLSPEICDAKPYNNKSDIWSMGCILYEMTSLKHPFNGKSVMDLVTNIKRSSYAPIPRCYRTDMHELVSKLLKKNPNDRPDVNSLLRFPIIWRKIGDYLSKEDFEKEFSHTVLHGLKVSAPPAPIKLQRKINRPSEFCNDKDDKHKGKMILKKNINIRPGVNDLKIKQFCRVGKSKANIYNKIEMKKHQLVADNPKLPKGAPQKDVMKNNFLIRRNEYAEQLKRIRMQNLRKNLTPRGYKDKASNMMNKNRKNIQQRNKKCFDESRQRDLEEVRALGRIESAKKPKKKAMSKNPSDQKSARNDAKFKYPVLPRRRNSGQPDIKNVNAKSDKAGRSIKRKSLPNIKDTPKNKDDVRKQWNVPQSSMSKKKIINIECLEGGDETDKRMGGNKLKHMEVKELLMTGTLDVINPILLRTCSEPDFQNIEGLSSSPDDDDDDDYFENKVEDLYFKKASKNGKGDMSLLKSKSMEDLSLIFHAKSVGELSSSSLESSCSESNDELNSVRESMVSCLTLTPRLNLKQDLENIPETNEDHTRSEKIAWEGTDLGLKLLQSTILRTVKCFDKNHLDEEYFEDADHDSTQFSS